MNATKHGRSLLILLSHIGKIYFDSDFQGEIWVHSV